MVTVISREMKRNLAAVLGKQEAIKGMWIERKMADKMG
jgi:hypothetical protein